jgi:hypothetical protein
MSRLLSLRPFVACLVVGVAAIALPRGRAEYTDAQLKADVKLFEDAKLPHGDTDIVQFLRKRIPTQADVERVQRQVKLLASTSFKERDQARLQIENEGPAALPLLRRLLTSNPELEVRQRAERCMKTIEDKSPSTLVPAAARLLGYRRAPGACAILMEYLPLAPDVSIEEEIDGVLFNIGLAGSKLQFFPPEVKSGKVDLILVKALQDKESSRRAIAALTVASFGTAAERELVTKLLADASPAVRFRAAQGLLLANEKAAIPVTLELLKSAPMELALQAEDLLSVIANGKGPDDPLAETPELREKCHKAWKEWLEKNQEAVDLSSAELTSPFGGLTTRAGKGAMAFIQAIEKSDLAALKKTTDVPFSFAGVQNFKTRSELDSFLDMIGKQQPQKQQIKYKVAKVVPAAEYAKSANENELGFLQSARIAQVQVVYTEIQEGPAQRKIVIPIYIRISGGRALCLGFGNPQQ